MKKRSMKKLELKKKVISDMSPSEIKAGYAGTWVCGVSLLCTISVSTAYTNADTHCNCA
ncbi:hypothetical protein IMCC3317_29940 [Kordia antarctica]|uniref:Uncharacterized protein n=1 Tax=Kordia antarctica TaxID=1218801 RepID=A0A7L4ZNX3_9FLAO|nr:hypothetical protein [Kordia antarctica]QHI37614.1 hypothetical protein IMCC3317_29940 [Kordia antarctica]